MIAAEIQNDTITNIIVCDQVFATEHGLLQIDNLTPQPGIGWTLAAGVWSPPSTAATTINQMAIEANLTNHLATIEGWIAANPSGAVLTASQTLVLARMLAGLTRAALGLYDTTGGS